MALTPHRLSAVARKMGLRSLPWVEKLAQAYVSWKTSNLRLADLPLLETHELASYKHFCRYRDASAKTLQQHSAIQDALVDGAGLIDVSGHCIPCNKSVKFSVNLQDAPQVSGRPQPNWRETLICPSCFMKNRHRAALQFFAANLAPQASDRIYVTEQVTQFYNILLQNFENLVGSEFLGETVPLGATNEQGVRNEDVTKLTFDDQTLDLIGTFDVLEHVPDYGVALGEFYRCLKPGGKLLISAPFIPDNPETLIRARLTDDGEVEHLLPPEYHGDPLNAGGVLCYQTFGWDLLDRLRAAGFVDVALHLYWSREAGYLGHNQNLILAHKSS